ncbi:uncharacterized protein LOC130718206 isoform X2 [Lotus japonicus]|uniref:uncharacterized protein LOC130718206 isoform X2 n=1 Tax=Lotus japonicus TaxID=34305 RepID=UPI00258990E2|nr:uncharacterized protein LOC130718206 isoform X2 [Lotus japonicus]
MAKVWTGTPPLLPLRSKLPSLQFQCCSYSNTPKISASFNREREKTETPQILKIAVSGVTELLRLFSPPNQTSVLSEDIEKQTQESPVSSVDDVLMIIQSDYEKAYFVTGNFTSSIYAENCLFEDPTIKFRGRDLYARNLKLLVPFFDCASIRLQKIEKDVDSDTNYVVASWKLRCLPYSLCDFIFFKHYIFFQFQEILLISAANLPHCSKNDINASKSNMDQLKTSLEASHFN